MVEKVVDSNTPTVSSTKTVSQLISVLDSSNSYEAVVVDDVLSLVTVRDVLKVIHPERTSVKRISFKTPKINPYTPIYKAASALVRNRIRVLPVVENSSLVGVVRQIRVVKEMLECPELDETSVEEVMVRNVITIESDASVGTVRSILLRNGISHLPVLDHKRRLIGAVTARDIVFTYCKPREKMKVGQMKGEKLRVFGMKIKGVADHNPPIVNPSASILDAIRKMMNTSKEYVLVKGRGEILGILTPRDIISLLIEFEPKMQAPLYIIGFKEYDSWMVEDVRKKIMRVVKRGLSIHPDIQEVFIDHKASSKGGEKTRHTMKARVYKPKSRISVIATGWDVLDATDELSEKLDRRLRRIKGSRS